jgi:hypothetical protein
VTGPTGGNSPLTSPEAIVAAVRVAVDQAVTANAGQQAEAGRWLTGGLPAGDAHTAGPHQHD